MDTTVLIVADDPVTRRLVAHHITTGGYDVVTAAGVEEAIDAIRQTKPAVVVTEWELPEVSGLDLCRRLRAGAFAGIYAIVLTDHLERERLDEALEAGADDCLTHPFHERELHARLRAGARIADLERALSRRDARLDARSAA